MPPTDATQTTTTPHASDDYDFRKIPIGLLSPTPLNPRKTILQPIARGIDFVGHVIKPWRRTTRPRTLHTALRRIETMPPTDTFAAGNSYLGLLRQASHSHADQAVIANALRKRGHCIKSDLSKAYRTKDHA